MAFTLQSVINACSYQLNTWYVRQCLTQMVKVIYLIIKVICASCWKGMIAGREFIIMCIVWYSHAFVHRFIQHSRCKEPKRSHGIVLPDYVQRIGERSTPERTGDAVLPSRWLGEEGEVLPELAVLHILRDDYREISVCWRCNEKENQLVYQHSQGCPVLRLLQHMECDCHWRDRSLRSTVESIFNHETHIYTQRPLFCCYSHCCKWLERAVYQSLPR